MKRDDEGIAQYEAHVERKRLALAVLLALVVLLGFTEIFAGSVSLTADQVITAITHRGDDPFSRIIWEQRMPRVATAMVAGAGLSMAGCVMQNNLKNPLASPSTLGVTNAAVFGANFGIIILGAGAATGAYASTVTNPYVVTMLAFAFSMLTVFLIVLLSKRTSFSPSSIVLAGVAVGSIFTAGTTILQYFANDTALGTAVFWSFGDLSRVSVYELEIITAVTAVCAVYFYLMRWNYNALANGDELARSLGVNTSKLIALGMILASLITAVDVSFMGMIGFIGLIGPQMMRLVVGDDHRYLIPASMLAGSVVMMASDLAANMVLSPIVIPVGAVTSLLGGPLFLWLLLKRRGGARECRY